MSEIEKIKTYCQAIEEDHRCVVVPVVEKMLLENCKTLLSHISPLEQTLKIIREQQREDWNGRVKAEAKVEELETENNDILGELERAADKHLRNLWKLGEAEAKVKELEKAIQVHEDLELRLAEGKHKNWLDWKQAEAKIKELEEEANR